jgi:GNAT superfamily N-acetyltransferase
MTASGPRIRAATVDDVPAIAAVMAAADEPMDWPGVDGFPYLEHLRTRAGARLLVAEVDGAVAGVGASIEVGRPDVRFLTDLFVDPARQDRGVGRALLDAALGGTSERLTFSSADDRALGAYIRLGMRPWWPLLYVTVPRDVLGGPAAGARTAPDAGLVAEPADVAATAGWSTAWTGVDRTADFAHYAMLPEAAGWVLRETTGSAVVAIAWARRARKADGRTIDHASFAPGTDALAAGAAVLRAGLADAPQVLATIPGPHPVMPWLLSRGGRIEGRDTHCATDPAIVDPERIFPSPGFL